MSTYVQDLDRVIGAMPLAELKALQLKLWKDDADGLIPEAEAQAMDAAISARLSPHRLKQDGPAAPQGSPSASVRPRRLHSIFPQKKPRQRPQDRSVSLSRRKKLAAFNPLPSNLAWQFTTGQQAVLAIIRNEAGASGSCSRSIPEIAARAGVSETTVRTALKEAARLGLVTIQERRLRGRLNLTNIVRIVSAEWLMWINRGPARKVAPKASPAVAPLFAKGVVQFCEGHEITDTYRRPSTVREYAIG